MPLTQALKSHILYCPSHFPSVTHLSSVTSDAFWTQFNDLFLCHCSLGEQLLKDGVSLENVNTKLGLLSSFLLLMDCQNKGLIFHIVIINKHYKKENTPLRERAERFPLLRIYRNSSQMKTGLSPHMVTMLAIWPYQANAERRRWAWAESLLRYASLSVNLFSAL